ncbi:MAG: hypothetical protein SF028_12115 [Candidatus Sumerlaeia bacterium]|nr:hypothetical protein [Candidatus Sumerlaeia bacterium]
MTLRRFLPLAILPLLAGCSIRTGAPTLGTRVAPGLGEPLVDEYWTRADEAKPKQGGNTSFWLLPNQVTIKQWVFNEDATEADYTSVRWHDLGVFILFNAPLWISVKSAEFQRGAESSSGFRFTWSPFWTGVSEADRKPDAPKVRAYGVPLLFSRVGVESERYAGRFNAATHLWTLGPFYASTRFDAAQQLGGTEAEPIPQTDVSGYVVLPLMAGGLPGALAWTSYDFDTIGRGDERRNLWAHGPLIGWLGYSGRTVHTARPGETREEGAARWTKRGRSLGGGILWHSSRTRTEDGRADDSRHGPLWGMLGWGRRDGGFSLYALWLPIVLGDRTVVEEEPAPPTP